MATPQEIIEKFHKDIETHRAEILANASKLNYNVPKVAAQFDELNGLRNPKNTGWRAAGQEDKRADYLRMINDLKAIREGHVPGAPGATGGAGRPAPAGPGSSASPKPVAGAPAPAASKIEPINITQVQTYGIGITSMDFAFDGFTGENKGVRITVSKDSNAPATKAGLKDGDIIVGVNGEMLPPNCPTAQTVMRDMLQSVPPGQSFKLTVLRNGVVCQVPAISREKGFFDAEEGPNSPFYNLNRSRKEIFGQGTSGENPGDGKIEEERNKNVKIDDKTTVDLRSLTTSDIVGDLKVAQDYRVLVRMWTWSVGGDRTVGKNITFEYVPFKDGRPQRNQTVRFDGGEGSFAQVTKESQLLQKALIMDENGNLQKFVPAAGYENVGIFQIGSGEDGVRVTADSVRTPGARMQLDGAVQDKIAFFLEHKELGDYFPVFCIEGTDWNGNTVLDRSFGIGSKVLYLKRSDLEATAKAKK